jgi:geranylgeranyl reductase family protein
MVKYDAVICGAGPSGSTAAKYMAEKGLSVLLLDKSSFPRDKPCGGALRPLNIEEFDYLKSGIQKIPHAVCKRVLMYSPSLSHHVDYNPKKPVIYNVQRMHFDAMLVDFARDAGAEFRENTEVKNVLVKGDSLALLLQNGKEVTGNVIIGAGGMNDPVAKYLRNKEGLPEKWPKSDIGLSVMEEYEVPEDFIVDNYGENRASYFHLKPNNLYGYAWTFPKINSLNIGFGAYWGDMKKVDIKKQFDQYLDLLRKEKLIPSDLHQIKPKGGLIPLRGAIKTSYSDGILLIGDAAGFVSPIGGDGIYYAMSSGRIAAKAVDYAAEHNSFKKDTLSKYQRDWYNHWGKDLKVLCYFADKISAKTEQVIKYASRDKILRNMCAELYNGECRANMIKGKIIRRMARDFFKYDVLRLN